MGGRVNSCGWEERLPMDFCVLERYVAGDVSIGDPDVDINTPSKDAESKTTAALLDEEDNAAKRLCDSS